MPGCRPRKLAHLPVLKTTHFSQYYIICYEPFMITHRVVQVILLRALLLISLNDTKLGRFLWILHHMPINGLSAYQPTHPSITTMTYLFILSVHLRRFYELVLDLLNRILHNGINYVLQ
jgi:hypothetical protein